MKPCGVQILLLSDLKKNIIIFMKPDYAILTFSGIRISC